MSGQRVPSHSSDPGLGPPHGTWELVPLTQGKGVANLSFLLPSTSPDTTPTSGSA